MNQPDFDELFNRAALNLFEAYQNTSDIAAFLQKKLPSKYGLTSGFLVNKKKQIKKENYIFYDQLSCPKLGTMTSDFHPLIPANYVYGSLSVFEEINQQTIAANLENNTRFLSIYEQQSADNQEIITPLNIWVATDLAPFISLNDLEDRLLAEEEPPHLVAILNRGLLVTLNEHTIQNIFALSQKENAQSFDKAITADLVNITQKTMSKKYFKMASNAAYKNCFSFYILLLELLKNQALPNEGLSAEMVGIW